MLFKNQDWTCNLKLKPPQGEAVLIEGLPGIASTARIAVDYLINQLNAKEVASFTSQAMPNTVYVDSEGHLEEPSIKLYYAKLSKHKKTKQERKTKQVNKNFQHFYLLTGDTQPITEVSCHAFCDLVCKVAKHLNVKEIITLGGIGLNTMPSKPKVYAASVDDFKESFKQQGVKTNMYGKVGPIVGVAGLLPIKAFKHGIKSACLLGETYNHQLFLGVKTSIKLLTILIKRYALPINIKSLQRESKNMEKEFQAIIQEPVEQEREETSKQATYIG